MSKTSSLNFWNAALVIFASLTVYGPLKPSKLTSVFLDWFYCKLETRMCLKNETYSCRLFGYISSLLSKIQTLFSPVLLWKCKFTDVWFPVLCKLCGQLSKKEESSWKDSDILTFPNSFPEFMKQKLGITWRRNVFGVLQGQFLTV